MSKISGVSDRNRISTERQLPVLGRASNAGITESGISECWREPRKHLRENAFQDKAETQGKF